jgi:hypothetical protein
MARTREHQQLSRPLIRRQTPAPDFLDPHWRSFGSLWAAVAVRLRIFSGDGLPLLSRGEKVAEDHIDKLNRFLRVLIAIADREVVQLGLVACIA